MQRRSVSMLAFARGQRRALPLSVALAVLSVLLLLTNVSAVAQTAPGTVIDNVARAEYSIDAQP